MDIAEFKRLWLSGAISSEAYYWHEGLADWRSLPRSITTIAEQIVCSERDWQQGFIDDTFYWFPCLELIRTSLSEFGDRDWADRWQRAGGVVHSSGRFLARRDAKVWERLGSTELFSDGLDHPFPPFAFASGMGVRVVPRRECLPLGIIGDDDKMKALEIRVTEGIRASFKEDISTEELKAIKAGLDAEIAKGEIRLKEIGFDLTTRRYVK